ncbi:hypothetical protein AGMMS49921_10220 [Endomicrobiia bacterium]|nr:hypothetical protein AGMMS49921_10220 [Endomicrobiia bacterium]
MVSADGVGFGFGGVEGVDDFGEFNVPEGGVDGANEVEVGVGGGGFVGEASGGDVIDEGVDLVGGFKTTVSARPGRQGWRRGCGVVGGVDGAGESAVGATFNEAFIRGDATTTTLATIYSAKRAA